MANTYSIVIPAYNESARLRATLDRVLAHIQRRGWDAEVLVVNDGSTDDTARIVQSYSAQSRAVRLIENPGNRGKGFSVRNGILLANGEVILFSDADLSSPIEEADKFTMYLREGRIDILGLGGAIFDSQQQES